MKFYHYPTSTDILKKAAPEVDHAGFFREALRCAERQQDHISLGQFHVEAAWENEKRPYYNLWPTVIPLLTRITLDFPSSSIRFPQGLKTLCLRFSEGHHHINGPQGEVRSILITPVGIKNMHCQGLGCWIDAGETMDSKDCVGGREGLRIPVFDYIIFPRNEWTVEYALQNMPVDKWSVREGIKFSSGWHYQIVQLVVTVLLIQDDPNLINPDVLTKDERRYFEALRRGDEAVTSTLQKKAFRRRGPGWDIGRKYERVPGSPYIVPPNPQRYWTGKGRTIPVILVRSGYVVDKMKIVTVPTGFEKETSDV